MRALIVGVVAVAIAMYAGIGHESQFVFTPEEMREVAKEAIAQGEGDVDKV